MCIVPRQDARLHQNHETLWFVCIVLTQGSGLGFCGGHNGTYESLFANVSPQSLKQNSGKWQFGCSWLLPLLARVRNCFGFLF